MGDGVKTTFSSTEYGRYFEAIPIANCEVVSFSTSTTFTADEDMVLYKVMLGDEANGDTGVYVGSNLVVALTAGAFFLAKGQSVNLVGDYLIIR